VKLLRSPGTVNFRRWWKIGGRSLVDPTAIHSRNQLSLEGGDIVLI